MIYSVRHTTIFRYEPAVRESVMEVRMQPRSEGPQRCLKFQLDVAPAANVMQYRDFMGNSVHHFDIAAGHTEIEVKAEALVELQPADPPTAAAAGDWTDLDARIEADDYSEMLMPSQFVCDSEQLQKLSHELDCRRRGNPFDLVTELNGRIFRAFAYVPNSTKVDSPIDEALRARQGVCQDFAHIMIALLRHIGVPARYVSGYLFRGPDSHDRSTEGASHAWVEALLPGLGWTAFDPTNDLIGGDRHIRVAIGRDYADVPPTRGVHKGEAQSELSVAVVVSPSDAPPPQEIEPTIVMRTRATLPRSAPRWDQEQQQQ